VRARRLKKAAEQWLLSPSRRGGWRQYTFVLLLVLNALLLVRNARRDRATYEVPDGRRLSVVLVHNGAAEDVLGAVGSLQSAVGGSRIATSGESVRLEVWTRSSAPENWVQWPHGSVKMVSGSGWYDAWEYGWLTAPRSEQLAEYGLFVTDAHRVSSATIDAWYQLTSVDGFAEDLMGVAFDSADVWQAVEGSRFTRKSVSADGYSLPFYLYRFLHTTSAFAPASAEVWRDFRRWFFSRRGERFLFPIVHKVDSKTDDAWRNFRGTEVAPWSLWLTRFALDFGLFFAVPTDRSSLSGFNMEALTRYNASRLRRYDISGHIIGGAAFDTGDGLCSNFPADSTATVINADDAGTLESWFCSLDALKIQLPGCVVLLGRNEGTVRSFEARGLALNTDGSAVKRAGVLLELLAEGREVLYISGKVVWSGGLLEHFRALGRAGAEVVLAGSAAKVRHDILYMRPSYRVVSLCREVASRLRSTATGPSSRDGVTEAFGAVLLGDGSAGDRLSVPVAFIPQSVPLISAEVGCVRSLEGLRVYVVPPQMVSELGKGEGWDLSSFPKLQHKPETTSAGPNTGGRVVKKRIKVRRKRIKTRKLLSLVNGRRAGG